jgi:hypothetical protein
MAAEAVTSSDVSWLAEAGRYTPNTGGTLGVN